MVDMVKRDIYPAVCAFMTRVAETINSKRAAVAGIDCTLEQGLLERLTALSVEMMAACAQLEKDLGQVPHSSLGEEAHYYRYTIFQNMERLRAAADALESITGADYWPYPSYSDILYSVR